jgi:hypothetical protein
MLKGRFTIAAVGYSGILESPPVALSRKSSKMPITSRIYETKIKII